MKEYGSDKSAIMRINNFIGHEQRDIPEPLVWYTILKTCQASIALVKDELEVFNLPLKAQSCSTVHASVTGFAVLFGPAPQVSSSSIVGKIKTDKIKAWTVVLALRTSCMEGNEHQEK